MRRRVTETEAAVRPLMSPVVRGLIEQAAQTLIDLLDAADAATADLEPDILEEDWDDEVVSEDDAADPDWREVGRFIA